MDWSSLSRGLKVSRPQLYTEQADYGLQTLLPQKPDAFNCVDVVAVHGLNGHYLDTWIDEATGVNWLVNLIPEIFRTYMFDLKARVMSFYYNSVLQFGKGTSDVFIFANQLLEGLVAERSSMMEAARPIVFICHSLGGLVFKQVRRLSGSLLCAYLSLSPQALVRAHEKKQYRGLRGNFRAVFFFGTPHRGSKLAPMATMLGKLLRAASLGTRTNVQLAKDLEPNSRVLERISESFVANCTEAENGYRDLKIVSCYETQKLDMLRSLVRKEYLHSL